MTWRTVKPGDVITWVYGVNDLPIHEREMIYSRIEKRYISAKGTMLVVSMVDDVITLLNHKEVFQMDWCDGRAIIRPVTVEQIVISS